MFEPLGFPPFLACFVVQIIHVICHLLRCYEIHHIASHSKWLDTIHRYIAIVHVDCESHIEIISPPAAILVVPQHGL